MDSIFTKIIKGDIPCYKIAEDNLHLAFLDINPLHEGHTLVIPKKQVDKLFSLSQEEYLALQEFTYTISNALEKAIPCNRVGMMVIGLEVPHAHIHLIPFQQESDLNFSNPRKKITPEDFENTLNKIKVYL